MTEIAKQLPYYETVAEPAKVVGVKIPDGGGISTAAVTCVDYYTMASTPGQPVPGVCGCCFGYYTPSSSSDLASLIPNGTEGAGGGYIFGMLSGQNGLGPVTGTQPFSGTPSLAYLSGFATFDDTVAGTVAGIRLVSGQMEIIGLASNFVNQGEIIYGYVPPYVLDCLYTDNGSIDFNSLKTVPGIKVAALAKNQVYVARYLPLDSNSTNFLDYDYYETSSANILRDRGAFIAICQGVANDKNIFFDVKVTMNYEIVPKATAVSYVSSSPCDNDPVGYAFAQNQMRSMESAVVRNSVSTVSANPLSSSGGMVPAKPKPFILKKGDLPVPVHSNIRRGGGIFHSGPKSVTGTIGSMFASLGTKAITNITDSLVSFIFNKVTGKGEKSVPQKKQKPAVQQLSELPGTKPTRRGRRRRARSSSAAPKPKSRSRSASRENKKEVKFHKKKRD